jgi:methylated-DNA-[protein]-cysteine S-methyltransferase
MSSRFQSKVYEVCKKIPKGRVSTYKEIAKKLKTKAYRAVGSALNKNPYAPVVPCHRVVNSDGFVGGFASGTKNKIKKKRILNFRKVCFEFN